MKKPQSGWLDLASPNSLTIGTSVEGFHTDANDVALVCGAALTGVASFNSNGLFLEGRATNGTGAAIWAAACSTQYDPVLSMVVHFRKAVSAMGWTSLMCPDKIPSDTRHHVSYGCAFNTSSYYEAIYGIYYSMGTMSAFSNGDWVRFEFSTFSTQGNFKAYKLSSGDPADWDGGTLEVDQDFLTTRESETGIVVPFITYRDGITGGELRAVKVEVRR